jgi:hypothetical protein
MTEDWLQQRLQLQLQVWGTVQADDHLAVETADCNSRHSESRQLFEA